MTGSVVWALLALAQVFFVPAASEARQARNIGGFGLTVFEDRDYRGGNATFTSDQPSLGASRLDNRISSLRVGPGEFWEACDEPNFRGRCQVFSGTEPDLRRVSWDNRISSVRRVSGASTPPPVYPPASRPPYTPSLPPGSFGIVLYDNAYFSGEQRVITSAVSTLSSVGFDNDAGSVRVGAGSWELCEDRNYRKCRVVSADVPDLASIGLARKVSSIRPYGGSGIVPPVNPPDPPGSGGPGAQARLILYDNRGFGGRSHVVVGDDSYLGNLAGRAESLRVEGGVWQVCDRIGFEGQCLVVSYDQPDLGSAGWRNRIRSARRVR